MTKFRVLVVKTSSMGDIIHTLPALTDARRMCSGLSFDWVVEKSFAQIPQWHPAVDRTIEIAFRKWRKAPWQAWREGQWQQFYSAITETPYDCVIDAQGLFKSALMSLCAKGPRVGLGRYAARESLAAVLYNRRIHVPKHLHAVTRVRQLFASSLGYACPSQLPDYGIAEKFSSVPLPSQPYVVFLQGTTWDTKLWPDVYWQKLAQLLAKNNRIIYIPWGNSIERERAEKIAAGQPHVNVLPAMTLFELAGLLARAEAVVAVDTGLAHLATALAVPTFTLYGSTNPQLTGTLGGPQTYHVASQFPCAPCLQEKCAYQGASAVKPACFLEITPEIVYTRVLSAAFKS